MMTLCLVVVHLGLLDQLIHLEGLLVQICEAILRLAIATCRNAWFDKDHLLN